MKIAYFINQYPKVSHSFIRREIHALERHGFSIERFAVKAEFDELVDSQDVEEYKKTRYLLKTSKWEVATATGVQILLHPVRSFSALRLAINMGWCSDRGILNHMFYFIEACILKSWLEKEKVNHVHAHFGTNSATVVLLSNRLGGPQYSFTVHGPEEFDKPDFISLGEKIRNSTFVVAISSYGRSQLYRCVEKRYWDKINVVHCGVDAEFHNVTNTSFNNSRNIISVGRLCEQKGQLLLVDAVARLVNKREQVHLILAGDGPMREELEEMIRQRHLEKNITITGWLSSEQIADGLINARALILPSFAEGLPVVIMEAMVLNRPVLSTYVAGIPELIIHGENGWLVPAGDIEKLTDEIFQVLRATDEELEKMGRNARIRVMERHNIDTEAEKLSELLKRSTEGELS